MYFTTYNTTDRAWFYGPEGSYDPRALAADDESKGTVSFGEVMLFPRYIAANPAFKGDVLTVTGANDAIFCDPGMEGCGNVLLEKKFYPNARSVEIGERSFELDVHD